MILSFMLPRPAWALGVGPSRARHSDVFGPCALACVRIRSAAAPTKTDAASALRFFRRSLGLAAEPTQSGAPCGAHALGSRRAADRFALLRGFGRDACGDRAASSRRRAALRSSGPHHARACALRAASAPCCGIRSAEPARLRFAAALASAPALRPGRLCPFRCAAAVEAAALPQSGVPPDGRFTAQSAAPAFRVFIMY